MKNLIAFSLGVVLAGPIRMVTHLVYWLVIGVLLLVLWTHQSKADELEFIGGSITEHIIPYSNANGVFRTTLADGGNLIYNPIAGVRYEVVDPQDRYFFNAFTAFGGDNSIGRPMAGAIWESGMKSQYAELGLVAGGYEQQHQVFADNGINTMHLFQAGDTELMPLIGMELAFQYRVSNGWFLAEHNIFAFTILNCTVGIGRSF